MVPVPDQRRFGCLSLFNGMIGLIRNLLSLNTAIAAKSRSILAYDEALALRDAGKHSEALPLLAEAAELGNAQAMAVLGTAYLLGQGTRENGAMALKWLESAVSNGYQDADSVLGMALATGKAGVPLDRKRARLLLDAAAGRGDAHAAEMLQMMARGQGIFAEKRKAGRRQFKR